MEEQILVVMLPLKVKIMYCQQIFFEILKSCFFVRMKYETAQLQKLFCYPLFEFFHLDFFEVEILALTCDVDPILFEFYQVIFPNLANFFS